MSAALGSWPELARRNQIVKHIPLDLPEDEYIAVSLDAVAHRADLKAEAEARPPGWPGDQLLNGLARPGGTRTA